MGEITAAHKINEKPGVKGTDWYASLCITNTSTWAIIPVRIVNVIKKSPHDLLVLFTPLISGAANEVKASFIVQVFCADKY